MSANMDDTAAQMTYPIPSISFEHQAVRWQPKEVGTTNCSLFRYMYYLQRPGIPRLPNVSTQPVLN